jgi:maleylpyruvate isomerase
MSSWTIGGADVPRTLESSRGWVEEGTALVHKQLDDLNDTRFEEPSGLPGWRRRELVAHLSANADALGNLVRWAATGVETPMYASPEERTRGIEEGAARSVGQLREWVVTSAETLNEAMAALTPAQWAAEVRTAQGRLVPASDIAWLRAREVMIHAVDLGATASFADLNHAFLEELGAEIAAKRGLTWAFEPAPGRASVAGPQFIVEGPLADVAAWLAGRPFGGLVGTPDGVPQLTNWL